MTDKKTKPIDISDLDTGAASDKGYKLELVHPTKNTPLGIFIDIVGKHGEAFRGYINEQRNDRMRAEAQAERKGKPLAPLTAEQEQAKAVELLVLCTTGWQNMIMDKEDLPFTTANAFKVYTKSIWVRDQVDAAIGDLENFI